MKFTWTPDRIGYLRFLISAGQDVACIAAFFGTTPASVYKARRLHGISWPNGPRAPGRPVRTGPVWTPNRIELLRRLTDDGNRSPAVASILGVSENAVRSARTKFGLTLRSGGQS